MKGFVLSIRDVSLRYRAGDVLAFSQRWWGFVPFGMSSAKKVVPQV